MTNDGELAPPGGELSGPGRGEVGVPFGRYRLLDKIASGGMADIFRGVAVGAQGFERVVAIKRIREEASQVTDIGEMFADEARVSALLEHPNIVQVYDFGAVEGNYYIAMEYLRGRNLDEVLRALRGVGERLAPALAVFIAGEVARGLAYAHGFRDKRGRRMDIIHRDISPANIMLLHAGAVKLLDFGIARVTSELRMAITRGRGGALKGKSPYVSPEQIVGDEVDARSDIFALGAVLWEALTGHRLFTGESDLDTMEAVMHSEIRRPSELVPGLPSALDHIVLTALARDVRYRYDSADQMAADLEAVMRSLPSRHGDLPALLHRFWGSPPSQPQAPPVSIPVPDPFDPREGNTRPLRPDELAALPRCQPSAFPLLADQRPARSRTPGWVAGALAGAGLVLAVVLARPHLRAEHRVPDTLPAASRVAVAPSAERLVPDTLPAPAVEPGTPAAARKVPDTFRGGRPSIVPLEVGGGGAGAPVAKRRGVGAASRRTRKVALANPLRGRKVVVRPRATDLHVDPFSE
jgi:serine/threonine protein kinase